MQVAVWNEHGSLDVVARELPVPEAGWVRLRVAACGICGSDLHALHKPSPRRAGMQPGHEITGWLDAAGDGVAGDGGPGSGTFVAVEPLESCGTCDACRRGLYNRCGKRRLLGFGRPGGFAEYVLAPAGRVHRLPAGLPVAAATLMEPFAVCVRGVRLAAIGFGSTVAILGAGSIGLLCIPLARAAGAREILVTARHPQQAAMARALGADGVFASHRALLEQAGAVANSVIETVGGTAETLVEAAQVAAPGATISMLGVFGATTPLPGLQFFSKELTLRGSNCYAFDGAEADFATAVRLLPPLAAGIEPLVTHRFALDAVNDAFATAADKQRGTIKVQVHL
jgi:threonine dehydrogenase-like Zn-dependent dehydrogenase